MVNERKTVVEDPYFMVILISPYILSFFCEVFTIVVDDVTLPLQLFYLLLWCTSLQCVELGSITASRVGGSALWKCQWLSQTFFKILLTYIHQKHSEKGGHVCILNICLIFHYSSNFWYSKLIKFKVAIAFIKKIFLLK